jgi:DNA-binding HxlR family transcriptional regulator
VNEADLALGTGFESPEDDEETRLAFGLLGDKANPLDLRLLEELLAEPKRPRDLKHLVPGKSDTPLMRALRRLGEAGLVRQGMNLRDPGDPRYYAATRLGVQVTLRAHEQRPVAEVLGELRDAGLLQPA